MLHKGKDDSNHDKLMAKAHITNRDITIGEKVSSIESVGSQGSVSLNIMNSHGRTELIIG